MNDQEQADKNITSILRSQRIDELKTARLNGGLLSSQEVELIKLKKAQDEEEHFKRVKRGFDMGELSR